MYLRKSLIVIFLLTLSGCSVLSPKPTSVERITYLDHKVSFPGETLGLIAAWYTGKPANWENIRNHNRGIDIHRIKIGEQIRIPERMLIRRTKLPKDFIQKRQAKVAPVVHTVKPVPVEPADARIVPTAAEETLIAHWRQLVERN